MKLALTKASTSVIIPIFIQDSSSTTGAGLTGLAYNTASLVCYYCRPGSAAAALSLVTQTVTGAFSAGGFVEIDATNMPGWYRLDLSNAICATGVNSVGIHLKGAANMAPLPIEIQLTTFDLNTAPTGGSPLVRDAGYVGDYKEDETVYFPWGTIDRSGASVNPTTAGTIRVYKTDGTGEVTAPTGITDTRIFDTVVGHHLCTIDLSATTFYEKGMDYSVVLAGAVIDGKTVNVVIATFSIEQRYVDRHYHYGGG